MTFAEPMRMLLTDAGLHRDSVRNRYGWRRWSDEAVELSTLLTEEH